jgi:hypothetical protein
MLFAIESRMASNSPRSYSDDLVQNPLAAQLSANAITSKNEEKLPERILGSSSFPFQSMMSGVPVQLALPE